MLNGWVNGERAGSGAVIWKARQQFATGEINYKQFIELAASSAPSVGTRLPPLCQQCSPRLFLTDDQFLSSYNSEQGIVILWGPLLP